MVTIKRRLSISSQGFTLLELMTVVAIVGIVGVISVPATLNLNRRIRMSGAQSEIIRTLRTAQSAARTFGETWVVAMYDTPTQVFVAAFPNALATASPSVGPTSSTFFSDCLAAKRPCVVTGLDQTAAIDVTTTTSALADCGSWYTATPAFCKQIGFTPSQSQQTGAFAIQVRGETYPDAATRLARSLCVRISSSLGTVRLDCS